MNFSDSEPFYCYYIYIYERERTVNRALTTRSLPSIIYHVHDVMESIRAFYKKPVHNEPTGRWPAYL